MAVAALTRKLPHNPVRTAPSLARRIVNALVVMLRYGARRRSCAARRNAAIHISSCGLSTVATFEHAENGRETKRNLTVLGCG